MTQTEQMRAAPPTRDFELSAFAGVWAREWVLFRRLWRSTTFSSIVEPTIYLLAFGFGLGSLFTELGSNWRRAGDLLFRSVLRACRISQ